jgi:hypothetical protein
MTSFFLFSLIQKQQVIAQLNKLYPNDQAKGYQLGNIRGAIVLIKDLL